MRHVVVIGCSGSGKTTLSRDLQARTGFEHIELDSFYHQPEWKPLEAEQFRALVRAKIRDIESTGNGWILDGNYDSLIGRDLQKHADTIVWLDLPRYCVTTRLVFRSLWRVATRQELWNGNRERWSNLGSWHPEKNIIRWGWVHWPKYHQQYAQRAAQGEWDHANVYRLRSGRQVARFLRSLSVSDHSPQPARQPASK